MRDILLRLANGAELSEHDAETAMHAMMDGSASSVQITAYLTLLRTRGETVAELTGSARAMRDHALPLTVPDGVIDTCGTGGDGAGTFNISTAAAIVAAAGGVPVVKHGNRAASSLTGSADVLAELGVAIEMRPQAAEKCLAETGICFLFAQSYHPAMKHVAPIRRELGYRTMFNFLGPLTNPARPKRQVLGAPNAVIAQKMAHVLAALGSEHALVVSSVDGLDEIAVSGPTMVYEVRRGQVSEWMLQPADMRLEQYPLDAVRGGDPAANAAAVRAIFAGETGARRAIVVANAAAAFYVAGHAADLATGARLAERIIDDGRATGKLDQLAEFSQQLANGVSA